jgi:integrase/recombinase XerD
VAKRTAFIHITDPNGMASYMLRYLEWMAIKNYSSQTVEVRKRDLHQFNQWSEERHLHRAQDITKPILERYQRHLFYYRKANGKPLSFGRQGALMISVKGFFKWCARNNHILYNPASEIELPRQGRRLPRDILTPDEIETLLSLADTSEATGLRDRALLETFYATGIRRAELSALNIDDINVQRGTLFVNQGKGKKDRMVPIGERALAWIEKYLNTARAALCPDLDNKALFLSVKGQRLSPGVLGELVRNYLKAANINKVGACHLFRHTLATTMLDNGADIRFIQEMLGHAMLETTQQYTHVSISKLKEIYNATHPAARLKKGNNSKKTREK